MYKGITVRELEKVTIDGEFLVVVKEPGECFKYECSNKNNQQRTDFLDRTIYKLFPVNDRLTVYCW